MTIEFLEKGTQKTLPPEPQGMTTVAVGIGLSGFGVFNLRLLAVSHGWLAV